MIGIHSLHLPKKIVGESIRSLEIRTSSVVEYCARLPCEQVYDHLHTSRDGLSGAAAHERLATYGRNVFTASRRPSALTILFSALRDPLVILLAALATLSAATGDARSAAMMAAMIALSVSIRLARETKANIAAAKLETMASMTATLVRDGKADDHPATDIVPGDIIHLVAGDMVPADVRITHAKDLFVNQGALTGESLPIEKHAASLSELDHSSGIELPNIAFQGTSISSGSATAVALATAQSTYLGTMATSISQQSESTAFDRAISGLTSLMLRLVAVLTPTVFVINGLTKGNWTEAFFFALAVAVGLTPEMLPTIVTVCLSNGAMLLSRRKAIVKRLNAIQKLGEVDILCTDKTGTLTADQVVLERHCDVMLRDDETVLTLAYLNSHFQTGLKSVLDRAILAHEHLHARTRVTDFEKIDEIPFDFERRMMSVVVRTPTGELRLITKGAPEEVFARCTAYALDGLEHPLTPDVCRRLEAEHERLSSDGFRVLAVARKDLAFTSAPNAPQRAFSKDDERTLVLYGYTAFFDPPKESAAAALQALRIHGVAVKVITGDNERVARKVCSLVGLATGRAMLGRDVEAMSDRTLAENVVSTSLFARVSPGHKVRIIQALQSVGHTVGFLGDGINDAPALHAADVGISVDSAVDVAKASADIILLERSLLVVDDALMIGRRVYGNILNYIRMGASSSFGNVLSVVGASLALPFVPMAPIQILANNLLYDIAQTGIPTDTIDTERITRPQRWNNRSFARYVFWIGPCSSLFDATTFVAVLYFFRAPHHASDAAYHSTRALLQTAWFVESVITQTLIVHILRTDRIPFIESNASPWLLATTFLVAAMAIVIPTMPLGRSLGFVPLPTSYWPFLAGNLLAYGIVTHAIKTHLHRNDTPSVEIT